MKIIYSKSLKPDIILSKKEEDIFNFLISVKDYFSLKTEFRVCGGWTRDKLMNLHSDDIDIALKDMTGSQFVGYLKKYPNSDKIVGKDFLVTENIDKSKHLETSGILILGQKVEFVNLRSEFYAESRIPEMKMGTPETDAYRRDLSINSIFYNIETKQIEDYVGGISDLKNKILRTPMDPFQTFKDDPLRMLRILRFLSRFNDFSIDSSIIKAMRDPKIHQAYAQKVATERAGPELMKMMVGEDPVDSLKLLFDTNLYQVVFKVPAMEKLHPEGIHMDQQTPYHKYNLLQHTLEVVRNMNKIMKDNGESDYMRGLMNIAALFHDFGKMQEGIQQPHPQNENQMQYIEHEKASARMADQILKSIGVGKDERDIVNQVVRLHMKPLNTEQWGSKGKGRFLRNTRLPGKEELHKDLWKYIFYHAKADRMSQLPEQFDEQEHQKLFNDFRNFVESPSGSTMKTVIDGNDVMKLFPQLDPRTGYIREILEQVQEWQDTNQINMSGDINVAKEQAIKLVQQISPQIIDKYREDKMGGNWFKKIKISQTITPAAVPLSKEDPEIIKGPKQAHPQYYTGMLVRDRRKGMVNPQEYGRVETIKGNKIKILWNPDKKDKKREEIFDMVEDTEILSLIVAEV
jgi:putative nucleotidyltransferase with HDIG domain